MLHSRLKWLYSYFIIAFLFFYPQISSANEEYAQQTEKKCSSCHIDPSGGDELTAEGLKFQSQLESTADQVIVSSILRLIAGYLHILTGVF